MNVLVIGGGGREHALAWKIAEDDRVDTVWVAPGNGGTHRDPRLHNLEGTLEQTEAFALSSGADLVIVGPEAPLVDGLADRLRAGGVSVVGPGAAGAMLEGSKAFAKEIMAAAGVPTARFGVATTADAVDQIVGSFGGAPLVVKADGLAGGKGVVVCEDGEESRRVAKAMLADQPYKGACSSILLEERLVGIETSYIVLTDGTRYVALPTSQDHKRLLDGDKGPNTGGMGAYSPAPFVDERCRRQIEREVIEPTLLELRRRNIPFRGFLYAGIMLTEQGPMVLEFNVRLGDPETQALMVALGGGFVDALAQVADGRLVIERFEDCASAAVVVLAAEGYPRSPMKGMAISGASSAASMEDVYVFHAGTRALGDATLVDGGRVLGITARACDPSEAIAKAYKGVESVSWEGMHYRRDIGKAI